MTSRSHARKQPLGPDVALLAVALASGLGALRLTTTPGAARLILSVSATVAAGHAGVFVVQRMRRLRPPWPVAPASGIFCVALVTAWISVPFATRYGVPTWTTVKTLLHRFEQAGTVIRAHPTPLPPTPGVVLCLIAGAGLAAVLARALWGWASSGPRRSAPALVALTPTFGLFAYSAVLSSDVDRVQGAVAYIASAAVFLVIADRPGRPAATTSAGAAGQVPRRRSPLTGMTAGFSSGALAVAVALVLGPVFSGMQLDALPFTTAAGSLGSEGPGSGGGAATGPAPHVVGAVGSLELIDNLQGVLSGRSQEVMFDARSSVPTYWQVGTLTIFNGSQWAPDPETSLSTGAQPARVPPASVPSPLPVLPAPAGSGTYSTDISLQGLQGRLLPVPPTTVSVSGPRTILNPAIGALYTGTASSGSFAGLNYRAMARTPASATGTPGSAGTTGAIPAGGETASVSASALGPYLSLPPSVPSGVLALAQQITSGAGGAGAQAAALARWFDSGLFRYTLDPPQVHGEDPLSAFLFVTRAGFCQQFAGAYAVLARSVGLPTRLAVGFTTGTPVGGGTQKNGGTANITYRVTGADAHVWPEVYLGPQTGWVSFDPTPAVVDEPNGVGVITGSAATSANGVQSTSPTTQAGSIGAAAHPGAHRSSGNGVGVAVVVVVTLLCVAGLGILSTFLVIALDPRSLLARLRRRRSLVRDSRSGGPNARVLARLDRASSSLRRAGLGRRPSETLEEHVERLRDSGTPSELLPAFGAYEELARLAERASYAGEECGEEDASEALRLCDTVRSSLHGERRLVGSGRRAR